MEVDIFSGIQPSGDGRPHLGNYFGALKPQLELSKGNQKCLYFIASLHALTSHPDPKQYKKQIHTTAATYMALGLPKEAPLFCQSDVLEIGALSFILACQYNNSHLDRQVSYKDKIEKGIAASAGLHSYPALMAADILMFQPKYVPVGADQSQHLQLTQQAARSFNENYGETFRIPEPLFSASPRVVGVDGQKMSKSYGNAIYCFGSPKELKDSIKKIVTDSRAVSESKTPDFTLAHLLYLFLSDEEKEVITSRLANGDIGYGEMKQMLSAKITETFDEPAIKYDYFMNTESGQKEVSDKLAEGAEFARKISSDTMKVVLQAVGIK